MFFKDWVWTQHSSVLKITQYFQIFENHCLSMFYFCLNDLRTDLRFLMDFLFKDLSFACATKCQMAKYQYCSKWSMSMQWFYVVISRKSRQYPSVLRMTWKRTKLEASQLTLSSAVQLSVLLKCGILTIKDIGFWTILPIPQLPLIIFEKIK